MRKFWLSIFIISLDFWWQNGGVVRVEADSCVVGPGVYCAAETCGVWYQPPNNCSTTKTHCKYYDPSTLTVETKPNCNANPQCDPPGCTNTENCTWDDNVGPYDSHCKINPEVGGTSCQYCYDQGNLCNCTDAYGTELSCCAYCPDGSGCDSSGGGGGGGGGGGDCTPGLPDSPTLTSPADGATLTTTSVNLAWQAPSEWNDCDGTHKYTVYLEQDDTPGDGLAIGADTRVANCSGITDTTCTVQVAAGHGYDWLVTANNDGGSTPSISRSFSVVGAVSGTVYLDENNTCSTSQPSNFGGGLTARLQGTNYSDSVGSNGGFGISAPAGSYTLDMTVPSGYICSSGPLGTGCGGGCPSQTGVSSPSSNNNFFFTQKRSAWWQAEGGDVYAGSAGGGTVVQSLIPVTVPADKRDLILGEGLLIYRSGNVALGDGGAHYKAKSAYKGKRYDFDFWKAHIGVDLNPRNDWGVDSISKPSFNGNKKYYWLKPSSGTAQLANDWQVASGEKYIVLINGNLRINHNLTVANGGFLAFIVKGNVTVDPSVTKMEGIYILDGRLVTLANSSGDDVQLQVGGTVVAWTGVELHRDLGAGNLTQPAEKFSYRLDLIENMPEVMRNFLLHWKEVPAGTFE